MSNFSILDTNEEESLHKTRLLSVEEKHFKRITKRLLTPNTFVTVSQAPTPPPDATSADNASEDAQRAQLEARRRFHDEMLLDFVAFDSSIARIQFLHNSNREERMRYKEDKGRILRAAQNVRDNTATLRGELEDAKAEMKRKKELDRLAEKITNHRALKSREEQRQSIAKLEEECRELEREKEQYGVTWAERREQFGRIIEEGVRLRRLIRDEKEEVERREGMAEDADAEDDASKGGATPKHVSSDGGATPRPDGGLDPEASSSSSKLKPRSSRLRSRAGSRATSTVGSKVGSRAGSRAGSRPPSPTGSERRLADIQQSDAMMADAQADTPMADESAEEGEEFEGEAEIPQVHVREPSAGAGDSGAPADVDKMDTT